MIRATLFAFAFLLALPASAADEPFDLFAFFDGSARSEGVVEPLIGSDQPFTAQFTGTRDGAAITLEEVFDFDGTKRRQVWELERDGSAIFGTVATEQSDGELAGPVEVFGEQRPDGASLSYEGYAPDGDGRRLSFLHQMTPQPDGTVDNHVTVSLSLLPLATADVTFFPTDR